MSHFKVYRLHKPIQRSYSDYVDYSLSCFKRYQAYTPCIDPDFDHSPRSGCYGVILHHSTPQEWGRLLKKVISLFTTSQKEDFFLFIKAWNEWGEGNYLEPDQKWGQEYIKETSKVIKDFNAQSNTI